MEYSREEVSKHNNSKSCWIIINDSVYDITEFLSLHPGGKMILISIEVKMPESFEMFHRESVLFKHGEKYKIGKLKD